MKEMQLNDFTVISHVLKKTSKIFIKKGYKICEMKQNNNKPQKE